MAATDAASRSGRGFTLVFLFCVGVLAFALWLQHGKDLDPCPWCVLQRMIFIVVGLCALAGALHRPGRTGVVFYGLLTGSIATAGIAAAGYHIWLQSDPTRALSCAGGQLERILDASRVGKMIPPLLQYDGPCTLKPWSLLGLSIPEWALTSFTLILLASIIIAYWARR